LDTRSPKYLEMAQGHISLSRSRPLGRRSLDLKRAHQFLWFVLRVFFGRV
jgi:hypothetical protein